MRHTYSLIVLGLVTIVATQNGFAQTKDEVYVKSVAPFFKKYCVKCHGGTEPEAAIALDQPAEIAHVVKNRVIWEKIIDVLDRREMPPRKSPQPSAQDRELIVEWADAKFEEFSCIGKKYAGAVTLRRLNRAEYDNTIRDLLGVGFKPADDFPSDDVGYGFDNIGDVLTMPPLLVEKYLTAAETIVDSAFPSAPGPTRKRMNRMKSKGGVSEAAGSYVLFSVGEVHLEFDFPASGEYQFRIHASGDQAGKDPVLMEIRVDDRELRTVKVTNKRNAPKTFNATRFVKQGKHRIAAAFTNDYYNKKAGQDRNLHVHWVEVEGPTKVARPKLTETQKQLFTCKHRRASEKHSSACLPTIIESFAERAFRRPVVRNEIDKYLALTRLAATNDEPFENQIKLAFQAILVSPHFLFRVELDSKPNDLPHRIDDFDLASRLSYFLWSSMPDPELFELARQRKLSHPRVLAEQVTRMLEDSKASSLVENFAGQWLNLRNLELIKPDDKLFPDFSEELQKAMRRETDLFFAEIMNADRSLLEFLDADFTFVNERLAQHYGIPNVQGEQFRKVSLDGTNRGGLLTQASILTITSNPTRTSPVKRGKWILENILGTPPPPPPPMVEELDEGAEAQLSGSLRQRMEQHREKPICASCHNRMDPLGFGFENFDAIGSWRESDGTFPIDPSGVLPSGESFQGPTELRAILRETRAEQFCRCITEKMLTYALGRGLEYYDKCAVDDIMTRLRKNKYSFSHLIQGVVESTPFQMRGMPGDEE